MVDRQWDANTTKFRSISPTFTQSIHVSQSFTSVSHELMLDLSHCHTIEPPVAADSREVSPRAQTHTSSRNDLRVKVNPLLFCQRRRVENWRVDTRRNKITDFNRLSDGNIYPQSLIVASLASVDRHAGTTSIVVIERTQQTWVKSSTSNDAGHLTKTPTIQHEILYEH